MNLLGMKIDKSVLYMQVALQIKLHSTIVLHISQVYRQAELWLLPVLWLSACQKKQQHTHKKREKGDIFGVTQYTEKKQEETQTIVPSCFCFLLLNSEK